MAGRGQDEWTPQQDFSAELLMEMRRDILALLLNSFSSHFSVFSVFFLPLKVFKNENPQPTKMGIQCQLLVTKEMGWVSLSFPVSGCK